MSKKIVNEKKVSEDCIAKYYLLEESENIYGVEIELYEANNMNLKTSESINKLTDSYENAIQIIKILADKDVTPNSLLYVIDEIFDKACSK